MLTDNKRVLVMSIISGITLYCIFHALMGSRGIINLMRLQDEFKVFSEELVQLQSYQNRINNQVKGLNENTLNIDLLDEQIRQTLGYADENELVIYNNKDP